jgi:hypothetical protein
MGLRLRLVGSVLAALTAGGAAAACSGDGGTRDRELGGLVTARHAAPAPDPARAARDPDELARALAQPWAVAVAALGPHRLTIRSVVEVKEGQSLLEHLDDTTTLDVGGPDAYHGVYQNSADYGREVVFLAGTLYQRPRYARWHGRAPESDEEPGAIRDQLAATLGDYYALLARGVELSAKGAIQESGRAATPIAIGLAPRAREVPAATVRQRAWRDDARVTAASGEIVLDQAGGFALRARVQGTVAFMRDGKPLTMSIEVEQSVAPGPKTIAAPEADQVVATPTRLREVDDRNFLLRGLAPPVGVAAPDPLGGGAGTGSGGEAGSAAGAGGRAPP